LLQKKTSEIRWDNPFPRTGSALWRFRNVTNAGEVVKLRIPRERSTGRANPHNIRIIQRLLTSSIVAWEMKCRMEQIGPELGG